MTSQGYVGRVPICNYGVVSVDSPTLIPGANAAIDTMTVDTEYGSGTNPWAGVDRLDGTHFVRLYPADTEVKGRIGTIDPITGVVSYAAEQSLTNMTAVANAAPSFQMLTTTLGMLYYELPTGGLNHDFYIQGFSTDAATGAISDSAVQTLVSNAFSQFQGSILSGMMQPYNNQALFAIYRESGVHSRNLYINAMTGITDKDTAIRGSDQVLVGASVAGITEEFIFIDAGRTKGLVIYNDFTDSRKTRVRPFSNAGGAITVEGTTYTEISTTSDFLGYGFAPFPDQGAVVVERTPGNPVQVTVHFIDYNPTTYDVSEHSIVTLDGPGGLSYYSAFSAQNIDANNILIVATGSDGSDLHMSAWVARCQGGVYSITGRTDVTTGPVLGGAAGEMTIAQLDSDWYIIQTKYCGIGSNWKIHLSRE